jgi:serine/threonine protein kinase
MSSSSPRSPTRAAPTRPSARPTELKLNNGNQAQDRPHIHQPLSPASPTPKSQLQQQNNTAYSPSSGTTNTGALPTCEGCSQPITDLAFIRVGKFSFHRDHFICSVCSTTLEGTKFHFRKDTFFCHEDYVNSYCKTCAKCQQKIIGGQFVQTNDKSYHMECLTCTTCNCAFENSMVYHHDDKPYCETHYVEATAKRCAECAQPIAESDLLRLGEKAYHTSCVKCYHCKVAFQPNARIMTKDGHVYCETDYLCFFARRCTECGEFILQQGVTANDEYYHPTCLKCSVCTKQLDAYLCPSGYLRCAEHSAAPTPETNCGVCGDLITRDQSSELVRACGMRLHAHCFKCVGCNLPLDKRTAKRSASGILCCTVCFQSVTEQEALRTSDAVPETIAHISAMSGSSVPAAGSGAGVVNNSGQNKHHHRQYSTPHGVTSTGVAHTSIRASDSNASIASLTSTFSHASASSYRSTRNSRHSRNQSDVTMLQHAVPPPKQKTQNTSQPPASPQPFTSSPTSSPVGNSIASRIAQLALASGTEQSPRTPKGDGCLDSRQPSQRNTASPNADTGHDDDTKDISMTATIPRSQSSIHANLPTIAASSSSSSSSEPHLEDGSAADNECIYDEDDGDVPPPPPPLEPIQWQRGNLIGTGSFGKVYMGLNSDTGEMIAVKQVNVDNPDTARTLKGEVHLMSRLRHPNIVSFLGVEHVGKNLNILMEYVPGSSIDSLLQRVGALNEKVICTYTKQLLSALVYCHALRVVHRDIKGKNILLDQHGRLKLADFGSAKIFENAIGADAPSMTYNYTPLWTAPEVLTGQGKYDSKIDIWSLGCVVIEMATGNPPWHEKKFNNPFRALYHIGNTDSIPQIPDSLSASGKDFLLMCLSRDPSKRPSAQELLEHPWIQNVPSSPRSPRYPGHNDSSRPSTPIRSNSPASTPSASPPVSARSTGQRTPTTGLANRSSRTPAGHASSPSSSTSSQSPIPSRPAFAPPPPPLQ